MRFLAARLAGLFILALMLPGCFQAPEGKMDEQKDPHFLAGRDRLLRRDYKGALDSFERALEANPRSSAAHFELGILYEERFNNYARAIYHYERHLELNPNSNMAEAVKSHIARCKFELAQDTSFSVVSQEVQKEMDRLKAEIVRLKQLSEAYKAQLDQRATNPPAVVVQPERTPASNQLQTARPEPQRASNAPPAKQLQSRPAPAPAAANPKTHSVRSGETPAAIARKYGVSLNALLAANPGLNPRKMKVGDSLKIPSAKP